MVSKLLKYGHFFLTIIYTVHLYLHLYFTYICIVHFYLHMYFTFDPHFLLYTSHFFSVPFLSLSSNSNKPFPPTTNMFHHKHYTPRQCIHQYSNWEAWGRLCNFVFRHNNFHPPSSSSSSPSSYASHVASSRSSSSPPSASPSGPSHSAEFS